MSRLQPQTVKQEIGNKLVFFQKKNYAQHPTVHKSPDPLHEALACVVDGLGCLNGISFLYN